jgi:shikimate kinase
VANNIVLIGMPGAGKSTMGVILAKYLSMDFIDTDILIQRRARSGLQGIVDGRGYLALRGVEEKVILSLSVDHTVIATGGSAVYSAKAMAHLKSIGRIVYLKLPMSDLLRRIDNFATRGIAAPPGTSFKSLFAERTILYRKYAEITIDCRAKNQDEVAGEIAGMVN